MYYSKLMYHLIIFITRKTSFLISIIHLRARKQLQRYYISFFMFLHMVMIIFFLIIFFFFIYVFFIHLECFLRTNLYFFKSRFTARVINAMASNQKTTTIQTLRKCEKEFQLKLDFDINTEYKFCCIRCSDLKKWGPRIKEIKNFLDKWIKGTGKR